jgi:HK97 family phage portal protein
VGIFKQALGLETLAEQPPVVGDYSANVTPPSRSASQTLTVDRALGLPAAYRAIQLIAGMGSQLAINSWRGTSKVNPTPALIRRPDPWRPRSSFIERYLVNAAVDGNNFLLKIRVDNVVSGVELLNPLTTFVRWERGVKYYDTSRWVGGAWKTVTYTDADVLHVWGGLEVPGHARGLGPIAANRYALTGHIDLREYAAGWFAKSDVPSGLLSSDQKLDPAMAAAYKDAWLNPKDANGNPITGPTVRVLGQGLSYDPVILKPSDAQWLEAQNASVLDIARIFGIPADYLEAAVDGSSLTYANLEMIDARFLRTTLFPVYLRKLEDALTELLPNGQEARFDTEALLRPDAKTRAEIDQIYLNAGVRRAEEIRDREGWAGPAPEKPKPAPQQQETPA